jgi:hypothetical protein
MRLTHTSASQACTLLTNPARHHDLNANPSLPVCPHYFSTFVYLVSKHVKNQTSSANHHASINRQMKMRPTVDALLKRWHGMLGLSRQSPPSWYRDRLRKELRERWTAKTPWQKLSETSDVFFPISRARTMGFPCGSCPPLLPLALFCCTRTCWQSTLCAGNSTERPLSFATLLITT